MLLIVQVAESFHSVEAIRCRAAFGLVLVSIGKRRAKPSSNRDFRCRFLARNSPP